MLSIFYVLSFAILLIIRLFFDILFLRGFGMQKVVVFSFIVVQLLIFAPPCTMLTCFALNRFEVLQIQKFDDTIECHTNTPFLIHTSFLSTFGAKLCIFDKSTSQDLRALSLSRAENLDAKSSNDGERNPTQKDESKNADVTVSGYMYLLVLLVTMPVLAVALILIVPRKTNLLIDKQNAKVENKRERPPKIKDDEML